MPQSIHCDRCRAILYQGVELKSPFEIIELYEGRCPKCRRKLSSVPINVEVTKIMKQAS